MPREKSPGLKILWIWTIGTAAILVTSVVRTRMRELENAMNTQHQQQNHNASSIDSAIVDTFPPAEELNSDEKL
ncbi:basic leucine zipper/W2 domain protein [Senna tora]|uniref:Basic leucine zipper/W2 domain protein n=1 Tax=Senna tora TaxID=362788 RepID=A0A835CEM0_9FABA|nr:basic leucine zipper/W2 domain protein [Senna tora]